MIKDDDLLAEAEESFLGVMVVKLHRSRDVPKYK